MKLLLIAMALTGALLSPITPVSLMLTALAFFFWDSVNATVKLKNEVDEWKRQGGEYAWHQSVLLWLGILGLLLIILFAAAGGMLLTVASVISGG